jgi:hypothetical protein
MAKNKSEAQWKVHTGQLFKEIVESNDQNWIFKIPLQILRQLLIQVGEEAIRLDDHKLNQLMIRLGIYTMSDPSHPDFNQKGVDHILNAKEKDYSISLKQ